MLPQDCGDEARNPTHVTDHYSRQVEMASDFSGRHSSREEASQPGDFDRQASPEGAGKQVPHRACGAIRNDIVTGIAWMRVGIPPGSLSLACRNDKIARVDSLTEIGIPPLAVLLDFARVRLGRNDRDAPARLKSCPDTKRRIAGLTRCAGNSKSPMASIAAVSHPSQKRAWMGHPPRFGGKSRFLTDLSDRFGMTSVLRRF
jgi:hypothetical protein